MADTHIYGQTYQEDNGQAVKFWQLSLQNVRSDQRLVNNDYIDNIDTTEAYKQTH